VRNAAAAAGFMSIVTNYGSGMARLMPMRVHLGVDLLLGATLLLSPLLLPKGERRLSVLPVILGAAGIIASLLTETEPEESDTTFSPSYELSEAVADPDVVRRPHLRNHFE
jgi:hypothetical protein